MKNKSLFFLMSFLIVLSLILAACAPAATEVPAVEEPAAEEPAPAEPTEAPAEPTEVPPEPTEAPPPAEPKTATITFFEEPDNLNPLYTDMWFASLAYDLMHLSFWNFDEAQNVNLELAAEFPTMENGGISEDGLTLTIPLREDAVWTDGTPVTAHDYVFTYEMVMAEGNAVQSRYPFDTFVESVTALDAYTVAFTLKQPAGYFSAIASMWVIRPVYQPIIDEWGARWIEPGFIVTNGPYVMHEWTHFDSMVLVQNPHFYD
ncbi:MAG: hypothetical protein E3J88_03175, partial [Anaerolineales bacterium]